MTRTSLPRFPASRIRSRAADYDRENRWVLLDYLDFVLHVQHTEERTLYNLERLWKDCPQIPLHVDAPAREAEPEAE